MTLTKAGQAGGKQMGGDIIKGWSTNSLCHKMRVESCNNDPPEPEADRDGH